ncbi:hypothetical protein PYW08_007606 [Mythimna loreyi]|uniref:Uncharacterized protein n=1 Tax=Mythimna loreyi TaxID=667449 RepID=A0ACC2QEV7_9NEOP|nr:hypothetical protein PYW08_007606 [Mythimna loreyi]
MRKKNFYFALLIGITFTNWIYWKCIVRRKWFAIKNVSIQPLPITNNPFLVIIVTSYVGHVKLRSAHRKAYPAEELRKINATRVFLIAQIPDQEKGITQSAINDESETFGDILQGTFDDTYRNLTHKLLMGLVWASTACQDASFILKVDDDTVYNLEKTYEVLKSVDYSTPILLGYINKDVKPERNKKSKYYVTLDEYPRQVYPPYLSGFYYITTPRVAAALCDEAIYHPYLCIEDIFVTGILAEALNIMLTELPNTYWIDNIMNCDYVVGPKYFDCRF